jgi:hypothetical protein
VSSKRGKRRKGAGKASSGEPKKSLREWREFEAESPLTAYRSPLTLSPKHPHHSPTPNRRGR